MSPSDPCASPFRAPIGATGELGHGSRLSPRRGCKRLLFTCLRVLGLTPPGYELSLLPSRHMSDLVHSVDTCLGGATYGRSKPGPRSRRETGVQDPRCSLHHRDSARTELFSLRGRGSSRRRQRGLLSLPLLR